MNDERTMLLELSTGQIRPMRRTRPLHSSARRQWEGLLLEEHPPAEWKSSNVTLLNHVIFLPLDGRVSLDWQGSGQIVSKRIVPGRISILPADHPYSVKVRTEGGSIIVSIEPKLLASAAAEQGIFGDVVLMWAHGVDDGLIREITLALQVAMRREAEGNSSYVRSLASTLAAHLVRHYSIDRLNAWSRNGGLTKVALRCTIEWIHDHLGQSISIRHLADKAELSACHFARMFKQSTGMSPHHYILSCRIARAKKLLMNRSIPLAEVALRSGFCDQGHMTRSFRRALGITPASFARSVFSRSS